MPSSPSRPHLSKSRYLSGLQCERRLWFDAHARELGTPPDDAALHIFRMGTEVGLAAHAIFPGGVLVGAPGAAAVDHDTAVRQTERLMADASVPAIFEAAFEYEGVRIRVDLLERLGGKRAGTSSGWGLREVKSSSKVKRPQQLWDLAIQSWVLEGCGLEVDSAEIVHVNGDFVRGSGEIDWTSYFRRVELIEELDGAGVDGVDDVDARVEAMHGTLAEREAPQREPGSFCKRPHPCNYWESCTAGKSASWFVMQTGASAKRKARMNEVAESGRPWFSGELASLLSVASPPVWALDFEAIGPAIPFFEGTRPYQALAFQWSLDRLAADGEVEHREYLASGREDPRPGVARSLVDALGKDDAPVLVYSGYEKRCLRDLAERSPEYAEGLEAIERRLFDLLPIVRAHVYHPDLLGSFTIKKVGPAFAPAVAYDDLSGVADGMAALGAFAEIVKGELGDAEEERLRAELLLYCGRDTQALLELFRALVRGSA